MAATVRNSWRFRSHSTQALLQNLSPKPCHAATSAFPSASRPNHHAHTFSCPAGPRSSTRSTQRRFHTSASAQESVSATSPGSGTSHTSHTGPSAPAIDARWLATQRARLGKCINFGLPRAPGGDRTATGKPEDVVKTLADVLRVLALEWREMLAGSEGFLTQEGRRGLWGRGVEWGEMVSFAVFFRLL